LKPIFNSPLFTLRTIAIMSNPSHKVPMLQSDAQSLEAAADQAILS
jgi:hypothetical protein